MNFSSREAAAGPESVNRQHSSGAVDRRWTWTNFRGLSRFSVHGSGATSGSSQPRGSAGRVAGTAAAAAAAFDAESAAAAATAREQE